MLEFMKKNKITVMIMALMGLRRNEKKIHALNKSSY